MREMPRYKSHKTVHALKIAAVEIHEDKSATIAPEDEGFAPFRTNPGWGDRFKGDDEDPGVYVVYDDGYESWSPTKAFEDGYSLVGLRGRVERPPMEWTQELVVAVGKCINDQRNGSGFLASDSWDRVCEIWAEAENRV